MAQLQITIDDGPQPVANALTRLLDELATRKIVAAFFNLGSEVKADPTATKLILKQGHILGNHSWDHMEPSTVKYSDAEIREQFEKSHAEVLNVTRVSMQHWRAPRLQQIRRITGIIASGSKALYTLSHCDAHADSKDSQGATDADGMLKALRGDISIASSRKTFRLLFHVKPTTANAFAKVLDGLLADKHTFVNFSQTA